MISHTWIAVAGLKGDYCLEDEAEKNSKSGSELLRKNETAKPTLHPISSIAVNLEACDLFSASSGKMRE